jgi:hypothetical protein
MLSDFVSFSCWAYYFGVVPLLPLIVLCFAAEKVTRP